LPGRRDDCAGHSEWQQRASSTVEAATVPQTGPTCRPIKKSRSTVSARLTIRKLPCRGGSNKPKQVNEHSQYLDHVLIENLLRLRCFLQLLPVTQNPKIQPAIS
jgi:hypothetical protein